MISIKSYLERLGRPDSRHAPALGQSPADKTGDLAPAFLQALRILLAGLPLESVDRAKGRGVIDRLLLRLDAELTPLEVLEIADEALAAIEEDAKTARDHRRGHHEELQSMIAMLTETVGSISVQKDSSVAKLKEIEQQIEGASLVEDMRAVKASLSDCLAAVREAAHQQQLQSTASIERMESQILSSKAHLTVLSRPAAAHLESDLYLEDQPEPEATAYAAIFLLDRADLIARRYGEALRNEVIAFVRQHFKKMLMPKDRFIRWNGAAFVVLLQRTGACEDVSAELRSVASLGRSQYFDVGDRSVLLDTSLTWTVFPQADFASPDLFFKAVDEFIKQTVTERPPAQFKTAPQARPVRIGE